MYTVETSLIFISTLTAAELPLILVCLLTDLKLYSLPLQSGQDLPPSCQKRETPYISMRFSSTAGISSMSLSTEVSVSYTFVANNQHEQEETA